jgi:hypothetical protein
MFSSRVPIRSLNTEGVITHAPPQALVCLERNAFGTPQLGRASSSCPFKKITSFAVDSSRSRRFVLFKVYFISFRTSQLTVWVLRLSPNTDKNYFESASNFNPQWERSRSGASL